jgi:hypothetical protein
MFTLLRSGPVTQDLTELFGQLRHHGVADVTSLRLAKDFSHISASVATMGRLQAMACLTMFGDPS